MPITSNDWPCDLCTETQYAGIIGNCTRVKSNGNPEFSRDTWHDNRGSATIRPADFPVVKRTCFFD
jgi:hypothetical protein